jgi:hypothetical protein
MHQMILLTKIGNHSPLRPNFGEKLSNVSFNFSFGQLLSGVHIVLPSLLMKFV